MIVRPALTDHVELAARDAPAMWPGARAYQVTCPHGVTSAAVIPGATPLGDLAVFDLVLPGHHRRLGCRCLPTLPLYLPTPARA